MNDTSKSFTLQVIDEGNAIPGLQMDLPPETTLAVLRAHLEQGLPDFHGVVREKSQSVGLQNSTMKEGRT